MKVLTLLIGLLVLATASAYDDVFTVRSGVLNWTFIDDLDVNPPNGTADFTWSINTSDAFNFSWHEGAFQVNHTYTDESRDQGNRSHCINLPRFPAKSNYSAEFVLHWDNFTDASRSDTFIGFMNDTVMVSNPSANEFFVGMRRENQIDGAPNEPRQTAYVSGGSFVSPSDYDGLPDQRNSSYMIINMTGDNVILQMWDLTRTVMHTQSTVRFPSQATGNTNESIIVDRFCSAQHHTTTTPQAVNYRIDNLTIRIIGNGTLNYEVEFKDRIDQLDLNSFKIVPDATAQNGTIEAVQVVLNSSRRFDLTRFTNGSSYYFLGVGNTARVSTFINYSVNFDINYSFKSQNLTAQTNDTVNLTQYLNDFDIGFCSYPSFPNGTLNITLYNETNRDGIAGNEGTAYYFIDFWRDDRSVNDTYSYTDASNIAIFEICIEDEPGAWVNSTFFTSMDHDPLYPRRVYWEDFPLYVNRSQYLDSHWPDINDGYSPIRINVIDSDGSLLDNALVVTYRFYPPNDWHQVERTPTGSEGYATQWLVPYEVYYRMQVIYRGQTLLFEPVPGHTITESTINLLVSTQEGILGDFSNLQGVDYTLTYNNATGVFTFTYADATNTVARGCLAVNYVSDRRGNQTLCPITNCVNGASGIVFCNAGITNLTGYYYANPYVYSIDGTQSALPGAETYNPQDILGTLGAYGLFVNLMILIPLAFAGLYNPAVGLALLALGLFVMWKIGFFFVTTAAISFLIVGIIYMMKRTKT